MPRNTSLKTILLYGGSFDPIHNGHLHIAQKVQETFSFDRFIFIPCNMQALKKDKPPIASEHRLNMLQLALKNAQHHYPFEIDTCELQRDPPSYTWVTAKSYRNQLEPSSSLTFLLGEDSFQQLPLWYKGNALLSLVNFLVIHRPGFSSPPSSSNHKAILTSSHGLVEYFDAGTHFFSSTQIRQQLAEGQIDKAALPMSVIQYIKKHRLYM